MPIPQSRILIPVLLQQLSDEKIYTTRTLIDELTKKFPLKKLDLKGFEILVKEVIQDLKDRDLIDIKGDSIKISDWGLQAVEDREDMQPEEELVDKE